ncbi:hypothetical protein ACLEJW_05540 [Pseudomonas sp. SMSB3]|uniref:hypothetical protein n=1 Tax=Pseudomonas sp. SMSB3 TaxID=3390196 RepID=UPI003F8705EE
MSTLASSSSGRIRIGKFFIYAAVGAGRMVRRLETKILESRILASVPLKYRLVGMRLFKLAFVLGVASVALVLAMGIVALWIMAALPISAPDNDEPGVHEVSHPQHQQKYPELYDEHGSLR